MSGNLAFRAVVPIAAAVTGFVIICCLLLYQVIRQDMIDDTLRHERSLAEAVVKSARYTMLKGDRETLGNIISNVGSHGEVEHVRIFNAKGVVTFSSRGDEILKPVDTRGEGCVGCHGAAASAPPGSMEKPRHFTNGRGKEILAVTDPIENEAECFNASCHFHPADQKVLGVIDIGFSQEPLQKTLNILRGRMILFTAMMLVLAVAGTVALLRRNVLMPIREVAEYAAALRRGRTPVRPHLDGGELGEITRTLQDLAERRPSPPDPDGREFHQR
jgi:hypothetical protein